MTDLHLTQSEADFLLAMEKTAEADIEWEFPTMGMKVEIPLFGPAKRERFMLDISRGTIDLNRVKYQNRARQVIILARLELSGPPHRNPDGAEVPTPHMHRYVEGFADKWAYSVPTQYFHDLSDRWQTLQDFMGFCNVTQRPRIRMVLL